MMAAVERVTDVARVNGVARDSWATSRPPVLTAVRTAKERPTGLGASPPALTPEKIENEPVFKISENQDALHAHPPLAMTPGVRRLYGVVGEIMKNSVVVSCFLPAGRIEVHLPPSLIPDELLQYGMPIQISLDEGSGIRTPVIERRPIATPDKLPGQIEAEAWIDSL